MPDLSFQIEGAAPTPNAAAPQISFKVRIVNADRQPVHSIALRVQVQIEPVRRRYTAAEQEHLKELFGEPERWSKSLHPLLWANANVSVAGFTGGTVVDVAVPCTFDFNVAVTKYIYGLDNGEIPTTLLFSGTIFYAGGVGLQVAQIPWNKEASYRLPVRVWKDMMDAYYPNTAWIALRRDVFERLYEFKSRHGIATWDQALERMLGMTAEVKS
ncbi:MAG TPA: DUF6084 family protein [Terriglobales bacterium]|nr:DUF6084 family protein [Terriglobales bacterium]